VLDEFFRYTDIYLKKYSVSSIGISCGSPLDSKRGIILSPPNLPGWDDVHIIDIVEQKYDVSAYIQNDANACALAEWKYGAGKGTENMIFLTFGTGMGAGLILNGRLYSGTNDLAGEVGHIRLAPDGPLGYGKHGSFEGFCSGGGIASMGREKAHELKKKRISFIRDDIDGITAKDIFAAANQGNQYAKGIVSECAEKLGSALSILIDILNPDMIVIGSIFVRQKDVLAPITEEIIKKEALSLSASRCKVVPALLGESIGDVAALTVATNEY